MDLNFAPWDLNEIADYEDHTDTDQVECINKNYNGEVSGGFANAELNVQCIDENPM